MDDLDLKLIHLKYNNFGFILYKQPRAIKGMVLKRFLDKDERKSRICLRFKNKYYKKCILLLLGYLTNNL